MSSATDLGSLGMPVAGVAVLDVGGLFHADLDSTVGVLVFGAAFIVLLALLTGLGLIARVVFVRLFEAEPPSGEPIWLRVDAESAGPAADPGPSANRSTRLRQPAGLLALTETERRTS